MQYMIWLNEYYEDIMLEANLYTENIINKELRAEIFECQLEQMEAEYFHFEYLVLIEEIDKLYVLCPVCKFDYLKQVSLLHCCSCETCNKGQWFFKLFLNLAML